MEAELIKGIIGSTIFIFIAIAITIFVIVKYYKYKVHANNEIFRAVIHTQEVERNRVARDIHDSLGGLLGAVKLKLDILRNLPEFQNTEISNTIENAHNLITIAVLEARNASNALVPETIRRFGLKGAINDLGKEFKDSMIVNLLNDCPDNLNESSQINIYRILLELFNNTKKYAQATKIELEVIGSAQNLHIRYSDNGIGFDFDKLLSEGKGNGLKNINFRVEFLNGKMSVENNNGSTFNFIFMEKLNKL